MSKHFGDLEGVETDIDVHAGTEMKHDCRLNSVLNRCKKINLTLNEKKRVFKVKEVTYTGHKLTQEATKPDDEKFVPLRTCQHQLTRKELKDYSVQSTTSENSFPIWHLSMNPLGCFCERILNFSGHMSKTKPFKKLRLS